MEIIPKLCISTQLVGFNFNYKKVREVVAPKVKISIKTLRKDQARSPISIDSISATKSKKTAVTNKLSIKKLKTEGT